MGIKENGKTATHKLPDILTDPYKGIIAHYILTNIWVDTVREWSSFEHFSRDSSAHYGYNGLVFYERHSQWYVLSPDLEEKTGWLNFLKGKSNR